MLTPNDREKAQLELQRIDELKKFKPFTEYYVARLKQRREALAADVLENDALTPEQREQKRLLYKEYGELLKMPDSDAGAAQRSIAGTKTG